MMTRAEGAALFERATENLAPLLTSGDTGDEVYRAFRNDPSGPGETFESYLRVQHAKASEVYGPEGARFDRKALAGMVGLAVLSVALLGFAAPSFGTTVHLGAWVESLRVLAFVCSVFTAFGALSSGIALLISFSEKHASGLRTRMEQMAGVDFSQMVEVVNPDEATALALDRAKAHALTARGAALTRARQHYYDLIVEVSTGAAGTVAGSRETQWVESWRRWCAIDDAWTDLVCDPLTALTHAELLDVTLPRTAAFVTAYAEARDAMTGRTAATVPADLSRLLRLVDTVDTAWTEAHAHAEHAGYAWLPEAERKKAATAEKALRLATDTNAPMGERANAAKQAARLLAEITTVRLPEKARAELDHLSRKALPASEETAVEGAILEGAILDSTRLVQTA